MISINRYVKPELLKELKRALTPKRYRHSLNVVKTALLLSDKLKFPPKKVILAAILHDCAKDLSIMEQKQIIHESRIQMDNVTKQIPELWHCQVGSYIAENKYNIHDRSILSAIRNHAVGKPGMNTLEKIIYISDFVEISRKYSASIRIRKEIYKKTINPDKIIRSIAKEKIKFLLSKNALIHEDTIRIWNKLIQ